MNNLSEEIIAKFLMGKCTEEELIQVNLWIKNQMKMPESYSGWKKYTISEKKNIQYLPKEWTRRKGVCTNVWP